MRRILFPQDLHRKPNEALKPKTPLHSEYSLVLVESVQTRVIPRDSHVSRDASGVMGLEFPAYLYLDATVGVSITEPLIEDH